MRLKDCFDTGLLRKRRPDISKSRRAMEIASYNLDRARQLMENGFTNESRVLSYTGMFQAARALLFKDGIFERSHACVVEYLRRNYSATTILGKDHIHWLDALRVERHESLYGLETVEVTREGAEDSLGKANRFVENVQNILDTCE